MSNAPKTDHTRGPRHHITYESALAMVASKWWEGKTHREIAEVQLFTDRFICESFSQFHEAMEKSLGRPVWTHEFGLNYEGIVQEFLGEKEAPTFEEILNLIPEDKRVLLVIED